VSLVPLLPRCDNLERGGGGNATKAAVAASSALKHDLLEKATLAMESFLAPAPTETASSTLSTSCSRTSATTGSRRRAHESRQRCSRLFGLANHGRGEGRRGPHCSTKSPLLVRSCVGKGSNLRRRDMLVLWMEIAELRPCRTGTAPREHGKEKGDGMTEDWKVTGRFRGDDGTTTGAGSGLAPLKQSNRVFNPSQALSVRLTRLSLAPEAE